MSNRNTPWNKHPSLPFDSCEEMILIADATGLLTVKLYIGKQDGFWLTGYYVKVGDPKMWQGSFVKTREPNRKWGQFANWHKAMEDILNYLISIFIDHRLRYTSFPIPTGEAMKVLQIKKGEIQNEQLKLF